MRRPSSVGPPSIPPGRTMHSPKQSHPSPNAQCTQGCGMPCHRHGDMVPFELQIKRRNGAMKMLHRSRSGMHTILHRLGDTTGQVTKYYVLSSNFICCRHPPSALLSQRYHACSNRSIVLNQAPGVQKFINGKHFIVVHSSLPLKPLQHKDI